MTGLRKQRDDARKEYERVNHILDVIKRRCVSLNNARDLKELHFGVDAIRLICECALDGIPLPIIADRLKELENAETKSNI